MVKPLSYIEISKSNLLHNVSEFRRIMPKDCSLVAVLKANAYGHGEEEVATILEDHVDAFQVDDVEELRRLRAVSKKTVLVFGYVSDAELEEAIELEATFGVYDVDRIKFINKIGEKKNLSIKIHLKVDALLGRQGVLVESIEDILEVIRECKYLEFESIYSHFSNIEDADNLDHADKQFEVLMKAKKIVEDNGFPNIIHHISATSGIFSSAENWGSSLLRLGIGLYGLWPSVELENKWSKTINLKPVMKWVTKIAQIKNVPKGYPIGYGLTFITPEDMRIAVVPQGYSDGFDRRFSNNGEVLICGRRAKILGRVAMNMFVIDVTNIPNTKVEDEIVLIGQQGEEEIRAEDLALLIGTINYEIVARVSPTLSKIVV